MSNKWVPRAAKYSSGTSGWTAENVSLKRWYDARTYETNSARTAGSRTLKWLSFLCAAAWLTVIAMLAV